MKKLLALALAVVMMMAIALPVFADEPAYATDSESHGYTKGNVNLATGENSIANLDQVVLEYGVHQAYEVTIPADIQFGYVDQRTEGQYTLSDVRNVAVSNIVIAKNETFVMTVTSAEGWVMADKNDISDDVNYTATLGTLKYTDAEKTAAQADLPRPNAVFSDTYDNNQTAGDAVVCTVLAVGAATGNIGTNANNDANIDITFATKGTAQEGLYVDTLTFGVAIEVNYLSTFENEAKVGPTANA